MEWINSTGDVLTAFTFYYPLFMSYLWMVGALYYYLRFERRLSKGNAPPRLRDYPGVTIVILCYNEEQHVRASLARLLEQDYPDFEIIAVNDGSGDRTGQILDEVAAEHPRLRVIHQAENQGKAMGLNMAAAVSSNEYLVCIEGDSLLDRHALHWMMMHFLTGPRVGAVTGNPRVRNRSTVLGRMQVGEFSSVTGLIKRAQRTYGRIFSISGVVCAFRKTALHDVGYWSTNMLTEDIDISWKLQMNHWDVRFEPRALCWILMPETLQGLWRQRALWTEAGVQALTKSLRGLLQWRNRRMWAFCIEYFISVIWAFCMAALLLLFLAGFVVEVPDQWRVQTLLPRWNGVIIGITCLLQVGMSLLLDRRYDRKLGRLYFWMIWYPLAYWLINVLTTLYAVPNALMRDRPARAVWVSPDRGLVK